MILVININWNAGTVSRHYINFDQRFLDVDQKYLNEDIEQEDTDVIKEIMARMTNECTGDIVGTVIIGTK